MRRRLLPGRAALVAFALLFSSPALAQSIPPGCSAYGLKIVNDAVSPTTKVDVTVGLLTTLPVAGGTPIVRQNVSFTIDLTVAGAGGLDAGAIAKAQAYNLFAIDGPGAAGFASVSSSPTLPASYTNACRLATWNSQANHTPACFSRRRSERGRGF